MTLEELAAKLQADHEARYAREYPRVAADAAFMERERVAVKPGPKYTKIDFGGSGRYMVENATGAIYGIKAYGVVHRGHYFGTLEAPAERLFNQGWMVTR